MKTCEKLPAMTRREFLGRTTASAVAAISAGTSLLRPLHAGRAGMFISLNSAVAPRVGPWPEAARLASRLGYRGIDWSFTPVKAAGLEPTKLLLSELRLKPTIVNLPMTRPLPFGGDKVAFAEALKTLPDDAAFAAALGCYKMMLVLPATADRPKDEQRKIAVDRLATIADILQRSNVHLGLEFLGPKYLHIRREGGPAVQAFIYTLPETLALANDSGPNVGVVLDIWHWHHSGGTLTEILASGGRIVHVHMSDAKSMAPDDVRDNMRVFPGEGIVDSTGFLQALKKIGYADGISPEPLGRIPADMSTEEAARLGFETTMAAMQKAGVA